MLKDNIGHNFWMVNGTRLALLIAKIAIGY